MASKLNKSLRKDSNAKADTVKANEATANGSVSMDAIASILDEHRTAILAEFKTAFTTLEAKFDCIQSAVTEHGQKIVSLESNANLQDDRLLTLETTCAALMDNQAKLQAKVTDLECRSRRNNIRIVGLPEAIEGPRPTAFFSDLLAEVLGTDILPSPPELDRAHRALTAKPKPGERPRAVIIRLHRYQQKEKIIREARSRRGKLHYRGSQIAIFEDYAPEVVEQRSKYREVLSELYNLGLKPALLYPARLTITTKEGGKKKFASVAEAKQFISSMSSGSS